MKKLMTILLAALLLVGCTGKEKTAKEHGGGISVEMAASQKIKHVSFEKYVDGFEEAGDNGVINADNSPFKKGQILWFDTSLSEGSSTKIAISYSLNSNGTEEKTTEKIDISKASKWVHIKFNQDMELEIVDME